MNNQTVKFLVGQSEDGSYLVATRSAPFICVSRPSEKEAVDAAIEAWKFYLEAKSGTSVLKVKETRSAFTSTVRAFIPQQVVIAEAC